MASGRDGRRDRNMAAKRARIFDAAQRLFDEHGFAAVSTQQVSESADVAAGTLFRYAASKGELLLMVYNEEFRAALARGDADAAAATAPSDAIVAMLQPVLEIAATHPENSAVYQRELLFGAATEQYRAEGLRLVAELEDRVARRLLAEAGQRGLALAPDAALLAAATVFAAAHLAIARTTTGAHAGRPLVDDLRTQVTQIVDGALAHTEQHTTEPRNTTTHEGETR